MSSFNIYMNNLEEIFFNSYKNNIIGYDEYLVPTKYGKGYHSFFSTENFHLENSCLSVKKDLSVKSITIESSFFILIMYNGSTYIKDIDNKNDINLIHNKVYLGYNKKDTLLSYIQPKNQNNHGITFHLSKEQLLSYLIEFDSIDLINKIESLENTEFLREIKLNIKSNYIIQKLIHNPYNGHLQKVYFESLVNELLISVLTDLSPQKPKKVLLSEGEKDILYKAKEILLNDLQNSPTIEELSKMVPMNQSKLTSGFRILFKRTIHQTLTEKRMEKAFENLKNLDMSIWEIAHEAGYINVSNFINVFRKYYGKTPGDMRKGKSFYL